MYKEFRADGWPMCPTCEEDELYSLVFMGWHGSGPKPTLEQCLAGEMRCYCCHWSSESKRINALADKLKQAIAAPLN